MEFTIEDNEKCKVFTTIMKQLREVTEYIKIHYSELGWRVQGMDSSQVCLYEFRLNATWFTSYQLTSDESDFVSISTKIFYMILNIRQEHQSMNIEYNGEKMQIEFTSDKPYDKFFQIPTMEIITEDMVIPIQEYDADIKMESEIFRKLISEFKLFDDKLCITCCEENIILDANGLEGQMKMEINMDDLDEFSINEGEELNVTYSMEYINRISECSSVSKESHISISTQMPLRVLYKLDDKYDETNREESNYIEFHLAPSIEMS